VEKWPDINKKSFLACKNINEDLVKYFIDHITDVDKVINIKYWEGNILLIIVTLERKINLVKYLIEHGENVNLSNDHHSTPLTLASEYREKEIVEHLLEHGADVHDKNFNGASSLKTLHFPKIENFLLQYGAQYWKEINNSNNNNK